MPKGRESLIIKRERKKENNILMVIIITIHMQYGLSKEAPRLARASVFQYIKGILNGESNHLKNLAVIDLPATFDSCGASDTGSVLDTASLSWGGLG